MKKLLSIALAAMMIASTFAFIPAQAAEFQGGTVITTHDGSAVTMVSDDLAAFRDGGFEGKGEVFDDKLGSHPFWKNAGMTFCETDAVEGKISLVVDYPIITEEKRGELGFNGVYIAPCFAGEAYCLEFYTKLLTPLDGDPRVMIYFFDPNDANKKVYLSVGTDRFTISADSMKGSEWENQKWVKVQHYFVTDESMDEVAFTMQIQNMNMSGPWGTSRVAIDAMSLTKVYIDENTMDPSLFAKDEPAPAAKSVKFTKKSVKIKKGKKVTLKVTLKGAKKATFSVDKKGKKIVKLSKAKAKSVVVTGKKKGKATITAKAAGKKATCKVTVK